MAKVLSQEKSGHILNKTPKQNPSLPPPKLLSTIKRTKTVLDVRRICVFTLYFGPKTQSNQTIRSHYT
jgi:hypothetical protein